MIEKKTHKQLREKIVKKQLPDDKKSFLKEIQNELVKLASNDSEAKPKTKKITKS